MLEFETSMLEFAEGIEVTSRLACQIRACQICACQIEASAELDGIIVRLPDTQH